MTRPPWIQTFTGRAVAPQTMTPADVSLEDIAHSLSMQCRFTGHVKKWYCVADHCIRVSEYVEKVARAEGLHGTGVAELALWGLLHDASEAYLVDVAAPVKHQAEFTPFRELEDSILAAVMQRYGLPIGEPLVVKYADKKLLVTEARDLMAPLHPEWDNWDIEPLDEVVVPRTQETSELVYRQRFHMLDRLR